MGKETPPNGTSFESLSEYSNKNFATTAATLNVAPSYKVFCKAKLQGKAEKVGAERIQRSQVGQLFTPRVQQNCGTRLSLYILKDNDLKMTFYSLPLISLCNIKYHKTRKFLKLNIFIII